MAKKDKRRTQRPRVSADKIKQVIDELAAFAEEFDPSDPEGTQVMLDEHISNLKEAGVVKGKRVAHLEDVLQDVLGRDVADELLTTAETVRHLIESYGDEPSYEDMEEAQSNVDEIIQELKKKLGELEQHE